jgi:iron uptake system EfeUOB component EfeO/EfeM
MISFMTEIIVVGVGAIMAIMGFLLKTSIFNKIDEINKTVNSLKDEVLREYLRKEEFTAFEKDSRDGRKELWETLNLAKERIAKLEK